MADAKFSFQEKGKMYHPAWIAPEVNYLLHHHQPCRPHHQHHRTQWLSVLTGGNLSSSSSSTLSSPSSTSSSPPTLSAQAMSKSPSDINVRAADMWSYAVLLWELATRQESNFDLEVLLFGAQNDDLDAKSKRKKTIRSGGNQFWAPDNRADACLIH